MLLNNLYIGALALGSSAMALPTASQDVKAAANLPALAAMMPSSALPAPSRLNLKYVVLGIGTQNYTCLGNNPAAAPGTTGAVAQLYDIGTPLSQDLGIARNQIASISRNIHNAMEANPSFAQSFLRERGFDTILGDHFFTEGVPTFSLNRVRQQPFPVAYVARVADTPAPDSNNIPWLYLTDNGSSRGGVTTVYRVETAGGKAPATCRGQPRTFEVSYTAQYWIYGP